MAGVVSGANLGAVADPRLGDEVDYLGTTDEGRGGISHEIGAPDTHGHNTIYLDSSITFENYHYVGSLGSGRMSQLDCTRFPEGVWC